MQNITAVLLAGGMGTRIRALYPGVPKPMIPVLGEPFLYWPTAFFAHHGIRRFVYSTGYMGEQIGRWCTDAAMPGLTRQICQESEPLGTGGGMLKALSHCGDWAVVANGDSLCLGGLPELLALAADDDLAGGIIGVQQDDTSRYGSLEIDPGGNLRAFREKVPGQGYVNGGIYLFRKDALQQVAHTLDGPCSLERDVLPRLLGADAKLRAITVPPASFLDIGTPETVELAEGFLRKHRSCFIWQA